MNQIQHKSIIIYHDLSSKIQCQWQVETNMQETIYTVANDDHKKGIIPEHQHSTKAGRRKNVRHAGVKIAGRLGNHLRRAPWQNAHPCSIIV